MSGNPRSPRRFGTKTFTRVGFIQSDNGNTYLYGYMEATDLQAADEAGEEEVYEIDREHHAMLEETLDGDWQSLELWHVTNPARD